MKLMKTLFSILIIAGIAIVLVTTRPSESDFAHWYVEQNQTGLGSFFDEAFEKIVEQRTETSDYVVFSVFDLDGEERYVGVCGQIFGRGSVEQAENTLEDLIEQAKEATEEK